MNELVPNRWGRKSFSIIGNDEIYSTLAGAGGGGGSNMHAGKQTIRRFNSLWKLLFENAYKPLGDATLDKIFFSNEYFSLRTNCTNFSAQLSRSYVFFKQFLLFGEEVKIFLIKKPVIIFIIFHLQKFRLKKTLLRYPFYNNNFIFANKRKTKIVILSIIPFYIFANKNV